MEKHIKGMGALFAQIMAVKPEDYIEPEKGKGIFEVTGHFMNDLEKSAYTVFRQLVKEVNGLREMLSKGGISTSEAGKAKAELALLVDKAGSIKNLLYFFISDRLNMWGTNIGVSQGWKIIIPDQEAERVEMQEVVIALELPREFRELFSALGRNAGDNEKGTDNTGVLSDMARNIMSKGGSNTTH